MDFNEAGGRRLEEERDVSQGDDSAGADTVGGRHAASGGPNVASGDDNSQSHEDDSSSTGSRSISQKTGCRYPGASKSESTEQPSGCEDDDNSDVEVDLEFEDDDKNAWIEASAKLMKKLDDGLEVDDEEYEKVREMLRGPQSSREMAHFKTKRGSLEKLDSFQENIPTQVPYTQWSNERYMSNDSLPEAFGGETDRRGQLVYSPTPSTWAYQAPLSPSGHAPPPSPWANPLQLRSDCILPSPSPILMNPRLSTASASPQFYSFPDLPSTNARRFGGETDRPGQLVYSPTPSIWAYQAPLSPSGHAPPPSPWANPLQLRSDCIRPSPSPTLMNPRLSTAWASPQFYSFSDLPSSNASASLPPPSTFAGQPTSTVWTSLSPFSYFTSQPSSNASASLPPPSTFAGQPTSTVSTSLPPLSYFTSQPSSNASASLPPPSTTTCQPSSTVSAKPAPNSYFLSHQLFQKPASTNLPQASSSTGQPASTASSNRSQPSTSRVVGPRLGRILTYARLDDLKALRAKDIWNSADTTFVTAILSNHYAKGGVYDQAEEERKTFKGDVGKLHALRGWDDEEKRRTQKEWDEIASQMRKIPLSEKSFEEALVDLETLLQMFQFSLDMHKFFAKPPRSILNAFEMASKIKESINSNGKPKRVYNPTKEEESSLAESLAMELLSAIPRYEDFPVPYMAGIEVPKKWFSHRFSNSSGLDRLGALELSWVTPQRYRYRKHLRFCYCKPDWIAPCYPYDPTTLPAKENPRLRDLLKESAGPPHKPVPFEALRHLNPAVLNNFMINFDLYVAEIKRRQWHQRSRIESLINNTLESIRYQFHSFKRNFDIVKTRYHKEIRGQSLLRWNQYINQCAVDCVECLGDIVAISKEVMYLLIRYSDDWTLKMKDMDQMLSHKIPLFDLNIADKRPQQ